MVLTTYLSHCEPIIMSILSDAEITELCNGEYNLQRLPRFKDYYNHLMTFVHDSDVLQMAELRRREAVDYIRGSLTDAEKLMLRPMIEPFVGGQVKEVMDSITKPMGQPMSMVTIPTNPRKIVSYGLSSYGYDLRIGNKFKIFTNINSTVIDPKAFDEKNFVEFEGDVCIIPPNSFVLAYSLEYLRMPRDVTGIVLGKSTYARCGIDCLATPLEAGWEGHVTLEFANTTPLPAKLYAGEGGCQVNFFRGSRPCLVSYADRAGKYMHQGALPVSPKV